MNIFAGYKSLNLTKYVCHILNRDHVNVDTNLFADGEISVALSDQHVLDGKPCVLVHAIAPPINESIMALLFSLDALKRRQANPVVACVPYLAYARRDADLILNLISAAGAHRCVTIDPHNIVFNDSLLRVDVLSTAQLFAEHISVHYALDDFVIVSPDKGGVERCRDIVEQLAIPSKLVVIDKLRTGNLCTVQAIHGDVRGKRCIIIDDIIDTGATLFSAASALMDQGALDVFTYCTHGVFSDGCLDRLEQSSIKKLIVTDTITLSNDILKSPKVEVISVAPLLADWFKNF
jgi:ribose-phosphate pyrophosphokinase